MLPVITDSVTINMLDHLVDVVPSHIYSTLCFIADHSQ